MAYFLFYPYTDQTTYSTLANLSTAVGPVLNAAQPPVPPAAVGSILSAGHWLTDLSTLTEQDTLVVVAHGAEGGKVMGSNDKTLAKNLSHIDQTEIIKRMVQVGLTKTKFCTLLIYSCYSGLGERPLACRIARQLQNDNFACYSKVYGCLGKANVKAKNNQLTVEIEGYYDEAGDIYHEGGYTPINADLSKKPTLKADPK
ncbi:MAG TPA: hypothetical protein VIZ65_01770 [Cellvibrionaceae bacterium]